MEHVAVKILNVHRTMAISTVRPDGWPQTTVVGYANRGFDIVFSIYRESQKYANIQHNDRVAIAVYSEPAELHDIRAVYAGGHAEELRTDGEREAAWRLLMERHPALAGSQIPELKKAVLMRLRCKYVSLLDYTQGLGHHEELIVEDDGELGPAPAVE